MAELLEYPNLTEVLQRFAEYFHTEYADRLIAHDRVASRQLLESVRTRVVTENGTWSVVVNLRDYWKYVENDTKPHWPPPDAILKWVEIKPTIPRPYTLNWREISAKSLAYLVGRKIARVGTKGTHDLELARLQTFERFKKEIAEALGRDVVAYIHKLFQNN